MMVAAQAAKKTMQTQLASTPSRVRACAGSRLAQTERQLARYRPSVQPRIRVLARQHAWIAGLAVSFPALLVALGYPRAGVDVREALLLATTGAPLATLAAHLRVPLWLRGFPPEAFNGALPDLPDSTAFRRRIANHLPRAWRDTPLWLESIALAAETADEETALWFAREAPQRTLKLDRGYSPPCNRRLVALWAWHARHTALAGEIWRPEMQWAAAENGAFAWRDGLELSLCLSPDAVIDPWLEDGVIDGYAFIGLHTVEAIRAEGEAMKHCVGTYGVSLASNDVRVWSIRRDGERVATLSVSGYGALPTIREIAGVANARAPIEIWIAARRWLHAQDRPDTDMKRFEYRGGGFNTEAWRTQWRPYWLAKRRIPAWLPLLPPAGGYFAV